MEQLPDEVGGLMHLRYLDLSGNKWKKLPDSLCNLINMETWRLEECEVLEELPEGMGKLTNLRHLRVKKSDALKLPKSIAKLTSLQTLDQVNIFGDGFHLSDLRNMDQLQGKLLINWKGPVFDGANKANLVNKKHLVSLILSLWCGESDEMLTALQRNPNLESLQIQRYSGNTLCPNWMSMSLNNLRYLALVKFRRCEFVPLLVLGKLVSLEVLQIVHMWKEKNLGFEYGCVYGSHTKLQKQRRQGVAQDLSHPKHQN
ncbi:hypothetical protein ACLB2K_063011 [Fragaria x ananassa]